VSRLCDRVLAFGCEGLRPFQLGGAGEHGTPSREAVEHELDRDGVSDPAERERMIRLIRLIRAATAPSFRRWRAGAPRSRSATARALACAAALLPTP
jgi:hypothetical protein